MTIRRRAFRRLPSAPLAADAFKLLSRLAEEERIPLETSINGTNVGEVMQELLKGTRQPIRLYGKRAEEMFAYVVAALGVVKAIKREETDDLIVRVGEDLTVPDFRLVMPRRGNILVEVKKPQ